MKTTPASLRPLFGGRRAILRTLVAGMLTISLAPLFAQPTGMISGTVTNSASGAVLQDARVEIRSLGILTSTDELGAFSITSLQPGDYELDISYMGLDTQKKPVRVAAGEIVTADIKLTTEIYKLEAYVVTGEREGNAAAITRQKNADNIKNVLALDAFGNLTNDNAGELLIRIPGVIGVMDDEGNVSNITVRGAPSHMTNFSVDGNQQASTGGFSREFRTHAISAALFDEIEVIKAPTPDLPSDSLGGSVNMKTSSTLRNKSRRLSYRAAGRWAPPFYDAIPMRRDHSLHGLFSLNYQDIFGVLGGASNLGITLSAFYNENVSGYYKNTYNYEDAGGTPAYISDYSNYDVYNNRKQMSASLRIDLRVSPGSTFYAKFIYNDSNEPFMRNYQARARIWDGAPSPSPATVAPGYTADVTTAVPDSSTNYPRIYSYSKLYSFFARERTFTVGGRHDLGRFRVDYDANHNYNHVDLGDGRAGNKGGAFNMEVRGVGYTIDKSLSSDYPMLTTTPGAKDIHNAENYMSASLTTREGQQRNTDITNFSGDIRYALPTSFSSMLKAGARHRGQKVETVNGDRRMIYQGTAAHLASLVDPAIKTSAGFADGRQLPFVDAAAAADDVANNPSNWRTDTYYNVSEYYKDTKDIREEVSAAYVQGAARVGRLNILAGARFEKTKTNAFGYIPAEELTTSAERSADPEGSARKDYANPSRVRASYDDWFPGIHLTYAIAKNFQARASWSNTIGRPKLSDLLPGMTSSSVTDEEEDDGLRGNIYVNNPHLAPQKSENWDLSLEYYFEPVGQFSVGYYRKNIDGFIVNADLGIIGVDSGTAMNEILDMYPQYKNSTGYRLKSSFNGGGATVDGLEISYRQELRFLPGIFKGLAVFANYTYLKSSGDYGEGPNASTDEMPRFVPKSGNAGLTWKYRKFTASVMANHTGRQLWTYAANNYRLLYREKRTHVNMSVSYRVRRSLTLFCDMNNVFNEPYRYHYYTSDRPQSYNVSGTTMTFGISGVF
ncbi:MAG: TonB-dependent receptor [Opitutaceae bacterium]|nr:TonB-dependent receptor [Opitutaceae bacterium]